MEKRIKSFSNIQDWIEKVIESCQTFEHTQTTKNLIYNFQKQIMEKINDHNSMISITQPLLLKLEKKEELIYFSNLN
jgi:hypothetical protein